MTRRVGYLFILLTTFSLTAFANSPVRIEANHIFVPEGLAHSSLKCNTVQVFEIFNEANSKIMICF